VTYDNTNSGVLFSNDKEGNPNRPDYTGKIDVEGTEWRLAGWIKVSGNGNKFLSLKVSPPRERPRPEPEPSHPQHDPGLDDEIPF